MQRQNAIDLSDPMERMRYELQCLKECVNNLERIVKNKRTFLNQIDDEMEDIEEHPSRPQISQSSPEFPKSPVKIKNSWFSNIHDATKQHRTL